MLTGAAFHLGLRLCVGITGAPFLGWCSASGGPRVWGRLERGPRAEHDNRYRLAGGTVGLRVLPGLGLPFGLVAPLPGYLREAQVNLLEIIRTLRNDRCLQ